YTLIVISLTLALSSCFRNEHPVAPEYSEKAYLVDPDGGVKTGGVRMIDITTDRGTFKVWTKRFGNNPQTKILLLNGGPGCTHEYFECFESFLPFEEIEFIYYDQLGCGNSENPNDSAFWDLGRFVDEVEQVRKALNLDASNFYLLGHSWGGILAMEYAVQYQQNLKGLIISNMMSSCPQYGKYADEVLAAQMDTTVLKEIRDIEAAGEFTNPRYMELLMPHFYQKHICRIPLDEWPEPVVRSFSKINQQLYVVMQGPSEFGIAGRLANWDRSADLKNLNIPVLTIGATHDTMDPEHMKWMSEQMPNGSHVLCPNGSHMCFYDDQKVFFDGLIQFIRKTESNHNH
ncbi:MAG: hypothetical protein RL220_1285, partial [Bacteroidota bacterium]